MLVAAGAVLASHLDGNPLGSPAPAGNAPHRLTEAAPFMRGFSQPLTIVGYLGPLGLFVALESQAHDDNVGLTVVMLSLLACMFWVFFASLAKRFHDIDKPGQYCLVVFVPLVGPITLIAMFFIPGTPQANEYGPSP